MKVPKKSDSCKILLQAFSCLLFVTGGISIIAGISPLAEFDSFDEFLPLSVSTICLTFVVAGVFAFLSTILCFLGSNNRNKWIVLAFSVVFGITLCVEISAAISGCVFKSYTDEIIEKKMRNSLMKYDALHINFIYAWDAVQNKFQCCGVDSYEDWANTIQAMPLSCCSVIPGGVNQTTCANTSTTLYKHGCFSLFSDYINGRADVISKTGILVALLQISGVFCAFVAYHIIRYFERKKKVGRVKVDIVTDERLGVFSI